MGDRTAIEWAANADGTPGATWNPIVGCSHASPGCRNCYAQGEAARQERIAGAAGRTTPYSGTTVPTKVGPVFTGKVAFAEVQLRRPLVRRKPTTWFVNSMGDLGAEGVEDAWLDRVWAVMALCPEHTFIVLTKRPERLRAYVAALDEFSLEDAEEWREADYRVTCDDDPNGSQAWHAQTARLEGALETAKAALADHKPLPNVWLGVTAEDQERANQRIPELLATPAAVRFVSYEPAIGPLDLTRVREADGSSYDTLRGFSGPLPWQVPFQARLDWVICGGESGRGEHVRPMHPDWARQVRDDCAAAGVPFFFKQWGEFAPEGHPALDRCHVVRGPGHAAFPMPGVTWAQEMLRDGEWFSYRVGKRRAGRLLDGVLHDARPTIRCR